jgi:hypothetical protein
MEAPGNILEHPLRNANEQQEPLAGTSVEEVVDMVRA